MATEPTRTAGLSERARERSLEAHQGQLDRAGRPYAEHPARVAQHLIDAGIDDEEILAAAYLHDTVEDEHLTPDQIRDEFGPRVAMLVSELTLPPGLQSGEDKHRALVDHATRMSPDAKLIKLADRLDNLSRIDDRPPERREPYARATLELLEALSPWPDQGVGLATQARAQAQSRLPAR